MGSGSLRAGRRPAGPRQPGHLQLERLQHRHRGDRRGLRPHPPGPGRAHAVWRSEGRQPLHLGRLRRHAGALPQIQRRAREGVAAHERQRRRASCPGRAPGCCTSRASRAPRARGARIYAELLGGTVNCGGHRGGGSMTAPEPRRGAPLHSASAGRRRRHRARRRSTPSTVTSPRPAPTHGRSTSWATALERAPGDLPPITSTKSMIGHTLGAAGAIESVACVLMLQGGFVHPRLNCEDVHPEIEAYAGSIPHTRSERCRS